MELRPEHIGSGVTIVVGSDNYPGTITRFSESGKTVWYTRDRAKPCKNNNPLSENQSYIYLIDPNSPEYSARLNKDGFWRETGTRARVYIGKRRYYRDPHF